MKFNPRHPWQLTTQEAIAIQKELASEVIAIDRLPPVQYVAGVDVGYEDNNISRAAISVLSFPDLQLQEQAIAHRPTEFPYITGFLSFREIPVVLDALEKLQIIPNLLLCDGQGYAHPRRFGIACHLGVLTDLPAIGVGKTRLLGEHEPLAQTRGSWQALQDKDETIGAVLRTRSGVKPIYVSIGHRISLPTAIDYVLRCTPTYRLPETTRQADRLSKTKSII